MVARLRTGDKVRINSALIPRLPARLAAGKTRRTSGTPSGETALGNSIRSHVVLADDNAPTNRRFSRILANCSLETSEVMVNCFTETIKVKDRLSALTVTRLLQLLRPEFLTSANKASSFGKKSSERIKRKNIVSLAMERVFVENAESYTSMEDDLRERRRKARRVSGLCSLVESAADSTRSIVP